jgi:hypothetical protein
MVSTVGYIECPTEAEEILTWRLQIPEAFLQRHWRHWRTTSYWVENGWNSSCVFLWSNDVKLPFHTIPVVFKDEVCVTVSFSSDRNAYWFRNHTLKKEYRYQGQLRFGLTTCWFQLYGIWSIWNKSIKKIKLAEDNLIHQKWEELQAFVAK